MKDRLIDVMDYFEVFHLPPSNIRLPKNNGFLVWLLFVCVVFVFGYPVLMSVALIQELNPRIIHIVIFWSLFVLFVLNNFTAIFGFTILYSELCQKSNYSVVLLIMKIEAKEENDYEIIKICSKLLKEGYEQTNFVISHSLFWIITIYLTTMTLSTYLAISFLFEFDNGGGLPTKIGTLVGSLFIISTIIYINFMSQEVAKNLHRLKPYIYKLKSDEKDELIEKITSFQGFNACGFFTLGKPLLTSIVANFTTFIIVLIQFKMAEKS